MELELKNINGEAIRKIQVPNNIFGVEMNDHVLHTVVKAYRANRRQGTHATKTVSLVSGGGRKPFKQKGTGSARQGSTRAHTHPGGGVVHGPMPRSYRQKTSPKLRNLALKVALSDKVRNNALIVVDDFKVTEFKTKNILTMAKKLNVDKATYSDSQENAFLYKSVRNIYGSQAKTAQVLNCEDLLRYKYVVISESGLSSLIQRLEGGQNAAV